MNIITILRTLTGYRIALLEEDIDPENQDIIWLSPNAQYMTFLYEKAFKLSNDLGLKYHAPDLNLRSKIFY